jgi:hypothetical protein
MGRRSKYKTEEERKEAQRKWNREYYHRNKDKINSQRMEKYYEGKLKDIQEKLSNLRK